MASRGIKGSLSLTLRIGILLALLCSYAVAQGKNPIILIPGLTGSELKHRVTGKRIWPPTLSTGKEDIRLPIIADPLAEQDDLIPGDVVRTVKVGPISVSDVYGEFIKAMAARGGYHEETWDKPSAEGYHDSLYVWAYDWRLDNVQNARRLIRDIEALKAKFKRPDLKFDLVAHSMGGIIARYAAMYGDVDLPAPGASIDPTWAGAADIANIVQLGSPNEGTPLALSAMLEGYTFGGMRIDLPGLPDSSRFTVFSCPSAYQLLPAPGTARVFDDRLQPVNIDIYDAQVWAKYGWLPMSDTGFVDQFPADERRAAPAFFAAALERAKRLHEALAAANGKTKVAMFLVGADCSTVSPDAFVLYQDKSGKWKTLLRPKSIYRKDGTELSADAMKKVMYSKGDGVVTVRSFETTTQGAASGTQMIFGPAPTKYICEEHYRLAANTKIQDYVISALSGKLNTTTNVGVR